LNENLDANELLREIVNTDTPEGFEAFYTAIWDRGLPRHCKEWVESIYRARKACRGIVIRAFVGSTKTTVVNNTFVAYRIGLEPHKRNLIIQANEKKSWDNAQAIANIIAFNPGWKVCFPNIVPDKEAGWSLSGYEVKRTDLDYGEWRRGIAKDPCFVGMGYASQGLPGMHPDGCLVMDDVNTEDNTRSERERSYVNDVLTKTVLSRVIPKDTWIIAIGTPWREDDALAYLEGTGVFDLVSTPILDKTGESVWPEKYGPVEIEFQRKTMGSVGFALTCMLDLNQAKGSILKRDWIAKWPVDTPIDPSWPVVMGVDYASKNDPSKDSKRDFFAVCVMRVHPNGYLIMVDGFCGQVSTVEAETKLLGFAQLYPTYTYIYCEDLGKGEEFYAYLIRNSSLKVFPRGVENKSKFDRFTKFVGPAFETHRVWVSDIPNDFLNRFQKEWIEWDNTDSCHDDTIDAAYHAIFAGLPHLQNIFAGTIERKPHQRTQQHWSVTMATGR
jgi:hypothetical protein